MTIVLITHDMHLMLEYCARAVVFAGGEVVMDGPSERALTDPEVIARASLKETSLQALARKCGIADSRAFVRRFIECDRQVRGR